MAGAVAAASGDSTAECSSVAPAAAAAATHAVAWEARVGGSQQLHEALHTLQPALYPSKTAAKRAVRRGTIQVDGTPATNPSQ